MHNIFLFFSRRGGSFTHDGVLISDGRAAVRLIAVFLPFVIGQGTSQVAGAEDSRLYVLRDVSTSSYLGITRDYVRTYIRYIHTYEP